VSDFRRYYVPGGTYFFTVVTAGRLPLFQSEAARTLLGQMIREQRDQRPFETVAMVLLPDHLHAIWTLPPGDDKYSDRWKAIKARFTSEWLASGGEETMVSAGYRKQRRRGIWQPRFMEHTIRDQSDLTNHADYLHYNPVKHKLAFAPRDWPSSSFHRFVELGEYPLDWGRSDLPPPDFGDVDEDLLE
jgi:putative transposase